MSGYGDVLGRDDDGDVSIDFVTETGDVLSISVSYKGVLSVAWNLDGGGGYCSGKLDPSVYLILDRAQKGAEK